MMPDNEKLRDWNRSPNDVRIRTCDEHTDRMGQMNIYTILGRKMYKNERFGKLRRIHGNNIGLKRFFD